MADYHVKLPTGEEYDIKGAADDADPMQLLNESLGHAGASAPAASEATDPVEQPEPKGRGFGESLYDRTIGEATRQADDLAGTLRNPDVDLPEKINQIGHGVVQGILTGMFPGWTAGAKVAGAGAEAVTGSKDTGDLAEVAAPLVAGVAQVGAKGLGAAAHALGGKGTLAGEVAADVGAGTTAEEAGRLLQAPRQGAREAIGTVSDAGSEKYAAAQAAARTAGAEVPADDATLAKAASRLRRDTKAAGGAVPGGARRVVGNILRLGNPPKAAKAAEAVAAGARELEPGFEAATAAQTARRPTAVSDLIEHHSNLSREASKLPFTHPARAPLMDFKDTLERTIKSAKGTVEDTAADWTPAWDDAKAYYRDEVAPVKRTANKALKAETPEQAARGIMSKTAPSRFARIAGAAPGAAEPLRSSAWTDAMDKASVDGKLSLSKLSAQLPKDARALEQWANTPARKLAVKAIQRASGVEKTGAVTGSVAMGAGALEFGAPGFIGGYAVRKVMEKALNSEPVARAMYRLYKTTAGTPAYKMALSVIAKHMGPAAVTSATRAHALISQEQE